MKTRLLVVASWTLLELGCGGSGAPSVSQCRESWDADPSKEKVLECTFEGGERATNELGGQKYLEPVGTCWDYNLVVAQRCGCRKFLRASICCRKGTTEGCDWRIGNSEMVDCGPFGEPKFGLSGTTEPAECQAQRATRECAARKDLLFQGASVGPCFGGGVRFACQAGNQAQSDFLEGRCGPTPEDCGCTLVPECSKPEDLKCYQDWKGDPEALRCFTDNEENYKRFDCLDKLKQSRAED
jgi:hypothetical protein